LAKSHLLIDLVVIMGASILAAPKRFYSTLFIATIFCTSTSLCYLYSSLTSTYAPLEYYNRASEISATGAIVQPVAKYFIDFPLHGPNYRNQFGELGNRVQLHTEWLLASHYDPKDYLLKQCIEQVSESMFPFIKNTSNPYNPTPLTFLKDSYVPGSSRIVIPVGVTTSGSRATSFFHSAPYCTPLCQFK
jgi:hypothetical protein